MKNVIAIAVLAAALGGATLSASANPYSGHATWAQELFEKATSNN